MKAKQTPLLLSFTWSLLIWTKFTKKHQVAVIIQARPSARSADRRAWTTLLTELLPGNRRHRVVPGSDRVHDPRLAMEIVYLYKNFVCLSSFVSRKRKKLTINVQNRKSVSTIECEESSVRFGWNLSQTLNVRRYGPFRFSWVPTLLISRLLSRAQNWWAVFPSNVRCLITLSNSTNSVLQKGRLVQGSCTSRARQ
jgi:hypothetical protein